MQIGLTIVIGSLALGANFIGSCSTSSSTVSPDWFLLPIRSISFCSLDQLQGISSHSLLQYSESFWFSLCTLQCTNFRKIDLNFYVNENFSFCISSVDRAIELGFQ